MHNIWGALLVGMSTQVSEKGAYGTASRLVLRPGISEPRDDLLDQALFAFFLSQIV